MNRSILCGGMLLLLASAGAWAATEAPAKASAEATTEQQWQQHVTEMQKLHQDWMAGKTPEERKKLMEQHWQAMGRGMQNMGGCMAGGPHMGMGSGSGAGMGMGSGSGTGMGMGGAGMGMGTETVEQVDLRIQHMEQMLEQLRAHRQMLSKP